MDLYELGGNLGITGALPIYWISTIPTGREQVCQEIDNPAQGAGMILSNHSGPANLFL